MELDLSPVGLFGGLVFSTIGLFVFRRGKKESEFKVIIIGMVLMGYPIFVSDHRLLWGIGLALSGWAYWEIKGQYQ